MKRTLRKFSAKFKANVAIEALKEQKSLSELASQFEIHNSEQGSQYTCAHWVECLKEQGIRISMDGKGRATDNAIIERWFRTLK